MLHAQASDEATSVWRTLVARHPIALAQCALFGFCLLAAACESEVGRNTSWSVTFACAAHAAESESVKVEISPATCKSTAMPVYRATIWREDAHGMAAPPSLSAGTYAFSATAYDSKGKAITTICNEVALPREHGVMLVLPGPEGCEPAMPPDGSDPGDAHAEGPFDNTSDGADAATAPPEPNPDPNGEPCAGACETTVYSTPTQDISLPKQCWAPGEFMPVTIHIPVTAKDWLWVKNHPDYGGKDQEFWDHTGITTASSVYRGGEREPLGLHAPTATGSFSITWHPNDASDKEVHSRLGFTVSRDCP